MKQAENSTILSSPKRLFQTYPEAGWYTTLGDYSLPDIKEEEQIAVPDGILPIIKSIIDKVEAALTYKNAVHIAHRNDLKEKRRSTSFHIQIEVPLDDLKNRHRGALPHSARKEIVELYQRAGWDSVDIQNPTWRSGSPRIMTIRLTFWQKLKEAAA